MASMALAIASGGNGFCRVFAEQPWGRAQKRVWGTGEGQLAGFPVSYVATAILG
jgi:hypothetical protein